MFQFRTKSKIKPKTLPIVVTRRKMPPLAKRSVVSRKNIPAVSQQSEEHQHVENVRASFYNMYMVLWIIFFGVTLYILFFSRFLQVDTIRIEGVNDLSSQEIQRFVETTLHEKYIGIIPKNTLLVLPQSRIESDMKDIFKKVRDVTLTRVFPQTLEIRIQERKTLVQWCTHDNCFFIDENGFAYAPVDASQSDKYKGSVLKIIDTSGAGIDMQEPLLDQDFVRFAVDIQNQLHQRVGVEVEMECSTPSRFSDELIFKTSEGWSLRVNVRLPMEKTLEALRLLLKKEISEDRRSRLKYIDIRTENRAYYSVEGETVSAPEPLDNTTTKPIEPATPDKNISKDKKK